MYLQSISIKNFRRLKDVHIELDGDTSIFVGANNSGKTSATHALQLFLGNSKEKFSLHDFNAACWKKFDEEGMAEITEDRIIDLPRIHLDLWFRVEASDLYRIIDILPNLDWQHTPVGIRLELAAKAPEELLLHFKEAKNKANAKRKEGEEYHPWPKSLTEYLNKQLSEFEIRYYVLDYAGFDNHFHQKIDYIPLQLKNSNERKASSVVQSLIRVDFLNAQRHLSDNNAAAGRAEDLTKRMNRFYDRNLQKHENNFEALRALTNSEAELDKHLATVFESTLKSLNNLGYPGFNDPHLVIKSAFSAEKILTQNTRVHYLLEDPTEPNQNITLPDKYNGLGFKNLIYMIVEILDFHAHWFDENDARPPLHLIVIEEPEAHLHPQLQQVFIREIRKILEETSHTDVKFHSQLLVTTHSSHIIYEQGLTPIRYFRRTSKGIEQTSEVLNLSTFYDNEEPDTRSFLQKYMRLTHCDLFFADATILVEGNVERLLLPLMIEKSSPSLRKKFLSIIEIGGAFAHRFQKLIEFLGITTLIITDIDSVKLNSTTNKYCSCITSEKDAVTSNQTLKTWLPKLINITDLLNINVDKKIQKPNAHLPAMVRVAYQTEQPIRWRPALEKKAARTFEEAFILENFVWTQNKRRKFDVRVKSLQDISAAEIHQFIYDLVKNSNFNKTDLALAIMMENSNWKVPSYIKEGLEWLSNQLDPNQSDKK